MTALAAPCVTTGAAVTAAGLVAAAAVVFVAAATLGAAPLEATAPGSTPTTVAPLAMGVAALPCTCKETPCWADTAVAAPDCVCGAATLVVALLPRAAAIWAGVAACGATDRVVPLEAVLAATPVAATCAALWLCGVEASALDAFTALAA